jgi:uncharacterized membrane protein
MSWSKSFLWWVMVVMALTIGAYALTYFMLNEMGDPTFKTHFATIPWSARLHIIPGGLALMLGAFQFHDGIRSRWTNIHRNCGRAYVIVVLVGAVGGFILAWYAPRDPATQLGFATLAVVWFYSACMAYLAVRAGNIALHKQWMIRSYALTLAAVTLRIQLPIYQEALGMDFDASYAIVAWFSWVPNLIIAEWLINQTPYRKTTRAR